MDFNKRRMESERAALAAKEAEAHKSWTGTGGLNQGKKRCLSRFSEKARPMAVKVDENEPNVFPMVEKTDVEARAEGKEIDVVLITRIEGKSVRIRVKLDQAKAQILADQLASPRRVEAVL
jgi:hypothetical protein